VINRDDHGPLPGMVVGLAEAGHRQVEVAPAVPAAGQDHEHRRLSREHVISGQVGGCRYLPGLTTAAGGRYRDPEVD
jgi:hypothetical protein